MAYRYRCLGVGGSSVFDMLGCYWVDGCRVGFWGLVMYGYESGSILVEGWDRILDTLGVSSWARMQFWIRFLSQVCVSIKIVCVRNENSKKNMFF